MLDYLSARHEPIIFFLLALALVDFLIFMRAWSFNEMSVKRILIFILKIDAGLSLSAALLMILANIPAIVAFFM